VSPAPDALPPLPLDALLEAFSTTVTASDGVARLEMPRTDVTVGGYRGSINGGVLAALVELAGHAALGSLLDEGEVIDRTAEVSVTYLHPSLGDPTVAEARVLRRGRLSVCAVEVRDRESEEVTVIGKVSLAVERTVAQGK
jgi:uncharacterized protein (TIGR00369 family)